jgi:hypothetical protein
VIFTPAERKVSWTNLGGLSLIDLSIVTYSCAYSDLGIPSTFDCFMVRDRSSELVAPELPPEIAGWFDFNTITEQGGRYYYNGGEVYIGVQGTDFLEISGVEDIWEFMQTGRFFEIRNHFEAQYHKPY